MIERTAIPQVIVVNTGHEHKTMHDINKIKIDGQNLGLQVYRFFLETYSLYSFYYK